MAHARDIADALRREAEEHFDAPVVVEGLQRLLGGASRELWGFEALVDGRRHDLVVRRDPEGVEDPAGRRRELEVLRAAHRHGVPVPPPFWLHGEGRGLVTARLGGEAIPRRLLRDERFGAARTQLVGRAAAAAAALHEIALGDVPALDPPAQPAALAGVSGLEAELDRIGEPHPALELGLRWLRRNLPPEQELAVVHGDFRMGNFLVEEDGSLAVLDWELTHAGDPAEDLGWMCARAWRFGNDDRPAAGLGSRDELLAAYADAGGRDVAREELRFWEAFACVRWGVICMVQADAHLSGAHPSLERAAIGRRTCEPEWDLLAMVA